MTRFIPKGKLMQSKKIELSCYRSDKFSMSWDRSMCDRLATLFELQGADVAIMNNESNEDEKDHEKTSSKSIPPLNISVVSDLKWYEESNFSQFLNIFTYGCYPYERQRWYETEVTTSLADRTIYQKTFKAHWAQYTSWCYFFYNQASSWLVDSKTTLDYQRLNTDHFDSFVSQLAYSSLNQLDWLSARENEK